MSRLTDAILSANKAYSAGLKAPMLDLKNGGQMGFAPDFSQYISTQSYIRRNMFCLLLEAPKGFKFLQDGESYIATLKALVELHASTIDGLSSGLSVQTSETPVGGSGQVMEHVTNVTEEVSKPSFGFVEKYGMPVSNFFRQWITMLLMDPYTKTANINTLAGGKPTDMLADIYSATMIFIETDPTHSKVQKAWLCTNMFPKSNGEVTGKRDLTSAGEEVTHSIEFSALTQTGVGVIQLAQQLLDGISIVGANPYLRPAFISDIEADVRAAANGFESQVEKLGSEAVKL